MGILAWIQAILGFINFAKELINAGKAAELNRWLQNAEKTVDSMKSAKTPEQKYDVAKAMVGLIGGRPSA